MACTLSAMLISSCNDDFLKCLEGNGNLLFEQRVTGYFDEVSNQTSFDVIVVSDTSSFVIVEADENLIQHIQTKTSDNRLIIKVLDNKCVRPASVVRIYVHSNGLKRINQSGSGMISGDRVPASNLDVNLSGSGDISFTNMQLDILDANVTGSGELKITGSANKSSLRISGSGDIRLLDLPQKDVSVEISGSGSSYVNASNLIDAKITGSGKVYYLGDPTITKSITGSGNVLKFR